MEFTIILTFIFSALIGFVLAWFLKKQNTVGTEEYRKVQNENLSLLKDKEHLEQRIANAEKVFQEQKDRERELLNENTQLNSQLSISKTNLDHLNERLEKQKAEMEELQEKFTKEFKLAANTILRQNSEDFSKSHQKQLEEILSPLKLKIKDFEENIEKKYMDETKERSSLKQEIKHLLVLNQTLSSEAHNLTKALKGDNKKQGNWGEVILERILESSGLSKGDEYETQFSDTNIDNKRIQPDVIIKLPEDKHIIIDSKVSLLSYERYCSCEDEEEKNMHLKNHLISVRTHVKGLSEKNYQTGVGVNSPDFVLLFIPIESSFSLAIQQDQQLYNYAWGMKVVIVSPTTLLATLRTISSVWKHEKQTKNALKIAKQAGDMFDKFKSFIDDMQKIERGLDMSTRAYNDAFKKLRSGTGNLVSRAEKLKKLGAKANKDIPKSILDTVDDDDSQTNEHFEENKAI